MCDSTAIYEKVGDARALALINRLFDQLGKKVKASGGGVVKTLGDGIVCQFRSAEAALRAACQMQAAAVKTAGARRLAIKIGCTFGPVVLKGGDVFGNTVNLCARLQALANPHQILTTRETMEAVSPRLRRRCRELYAVRVRGQAGETAVCEVVWRDDPDLTEMNLAPSGIARRDSWVLKLSYGGSSVTVDPSTPVRLGRDKSNDVVVPSSLASRLHARIFSREGHFVIVDQSSNGTFLLMDGSPQELRLRREEALLGERGWIGLGKPASHHGAHVLRYRLERRGR